MLYISHTGCQCVSYPWSSALDQSVVPISSWSRTERGASSHALHARSRTALGRKDRDLDGVIDTQPRRGLERRCDLFFTTRAAPTVERRNIRPLVDVYRACHSACGSSPLRPPSQCRRTDTRRPRPARRGRRLELVLVTGALRSRRPSDPLEQIQLRSFAEWDGRAPTQ